MKGTAVLARGRVIGHDPSDGAIEVEFSPCEEMSPRDAWIPRADIVNPCTDYPRSEPVSYRDAFGDGWAAALATCISKLRGIDGPPQRPETPRVEPLTASVLISQSTETGRWSVVSERGDITVHCPTEDVADRVAAMLTGSTE